MTYRYKIFSNFICIALTCSILGGALYAANKALPLHTSLATGKKFLYLQKNFKKICNSKKLRSFPLWVTPLFQKKRGDAQNTLKAFEYQVRVLLDEVTDENIRMIGSEKGAVVSSADNLTKGHTIRDQHIEIVFKHSCWYVNKKKSPCSELLIRPIQGHLSCDDRKYAGTILLIADGSKGYIVSQLDIEEYIYSVLRSESWPGWPIEVNKVFAIASRSYLVAKILESAKKGCSFHIKNTNIHQTYTGVHDFINLRKAVDETKGVILSYDEQPIIAMFDSCCGGIIPAHIENAVDFEKAPYLAREYACNFCEDYRIFSWEIEYAFHEVAELLKQSGIPITQLYDIKVVKSDKAGVVQEVMIHDGTSTYMLNGKQCYSLFESVKSFCFSIAKKKKKVVLTGRGFGHHIGLCQWGARAMIDHGWDYKRILQFYYPNTEFVRLRMS